MVNQTVSIQWFIATIVKFYCAEKKYIYQRILGLINFIGKLFIYDLKCNIELFYYVFITISKILVCKN